MICYFLLLFVPIFYYCSFLRSSVLDPDPGPYVFGSPDPDPSIIKQKSKKNWISTILWLLNDFLSMKTDVNVILKSNKQKIFEKNNLFLLASWKPLAKRVGSGYRSTILLPAEIKHLDAS